MQIAQIIIFVANILSLLLFIYFDINGRKAKEPSGFAGVLATLLIFSGWAYVYWKAGAFSTLSLFN